jgi:sec-independent protein translocase protein TatA
MNIMFAAWLGGMEVVLILAVVLILFGAKKLPELAKGLGSGIKEFKKATREVTDEIQNSTTDATTTTPKTPAIGQSQAQPAQPAATVSQSSTPPKA